MKTQSSGGFAVGADSLTFTTNWRRPRGRLSSRQRWTVIESRFPSRARRPRSAPCAVGVFWPPVWRLFVVHDRTRFDGRAGRWSRAPQVHQRRAVAVEHEDRVAGLAGEAEADGQAMPILPVLKFCGRSPAAAGHAQVSEARDDRRRAGEVDNDAGRVKTIHVFSGV
jgi:hypothetical protein